MSSYDEGIGFTPTRELMLAWLPVRMILRCLRLLVPGVSIAGCGLIIRVGAAERAVKLAHESVASVAVSQLASRCR